MGMTGDLNSTDFLLPATDESFDLGPIHYASESPIVAVTKNNFRDGEKQIFSNDLELSLFLADVNPNGSFSNLKAFPYNEVGYATGFGTLNPTGKILYFASNRPGGYGGFDLYVSYFKNGQWTYPDNLGPQINSQGNEITPYFDGETLYFSSDYWMGMGGYDVFSSFVHQGKWQVPGNLENGVNSPEDDYYFIKHPFMESFYLTSNRLGGRGYHDIYLVHKAPEQEVVASMDIAPPAVDLEDDVVEEIDWAANTSFVNYTEEGSAEPIDYNPDVVPEPVNLDAVEEVPAAVDLENKDSFDAVVIEVLTKEELEAKRNEAKLNEEKAITEEVIVEDASIEDSKAKEENTENSIEEKKNEGKLIDFDKMFITEDTNMDNSESSSLTLAGAKRVSYNDVINNLDEGVYFIQLAALFRSQGDMSLFNTLTRFGNLYKIQSANSTKVKLGFFENEDHAKNVLSKIKALGYHDAFMTYEIMNPAKNGIDEYFRGKNY